MVVGVVSDTHIPSRARVLPAELLEAFAGVDLILHAGDLTELSVLDPLRAIAPVHAVVGNVDGWDVARALPETTTVAVEGVIIGLCHGHVGSGRSTPERSASLFPAARVVVFGHSHEPLIEERRGQLLVNPGSPTDRRRATHHSCARLTIVGTKVEAALLTW